MSAFTCEVTKALIVAFSSAVSPILEESPFINASLTIIDILKLVKLSSELKVD
ncbi:MAG: hypothetical protein RR138_00760 [Akkermansia sp.]